MLIKSTFVIFLSLFCTTYTMEDRPNYMNLHHPKRVNLINPRDYQNPIFLKSYCPWCPALSSSYNLEKFVNHLLKYHPYRCPEGRASALGIVIDLVQNHGFYFNRTQFQHRFDDQTPNTITLQTLDCQKEIIHAQFATEETDKLLSE